MSEKKRLRRRCSGGYYGNCIYGGIFPVRREDDPWVRESDPDFQIYVEWVPEPYASEILRDDTLMWICTKCQRDSSHNI